MATVATDAAVQSWINKGKNDIPDWVKPRMVGRREANGTFMIHTRAGLDKVQARVLVGHIVIERKNVLYTRPPNEARGLLDELDEKESGVYGLLDKKGDGAKAEADVAPRDDDTDDISLRIQAQKAASTPPVKQASTALKPQKTNENGPPVATARATHRQWPAAKGNPPSVENRNPSELRLDDSYQRSTDNGASRALINRIATGWDWRMCLPLVVSKRDDGSLWVIDGQHRLAAALLRGDIPFLPCVVGVYGSVADEAAMFVAMNRARKPMNRLDDFHAAIASGDDVAIEIAQLINDAGLTVSRKTNSQGWRPGEVAFTGAIAKVLRKHGAEVCAGALRAIADTWPGQVLNAGSSMFLALAKLAVNPPDGFDQPRLMQALARRDQREWASFLNEVKGGGDERALQLRKVLLMAYDEEACTADPDAETGCADDALPGPPEAWRDAAASSNPLGESTDTQ